MAGGSTFTWRHALTLHSTLSPFSSPLPVTHQAFKDIEPVSWRRVNIAGILVTVYGLEELTNGVEDVTCIWLLHGRGDTQDSMSSVAAAFISAWKAHSHDPRKHIICIAFDQRNHGSRMVDNLANISWAQGNPSHGPDMFNLYSGTAKDLSHLLSHLPSYLPHKLRDHIACGVSLGGHATWQLLVNEPRITAAIVVIGCPDYVRLMTDRAIRSKLPSTRDTEPPGMKFLGSSDFPRPLIEAVQKYDPAGILLGELDVVTGNDHLHPPSQSEITTLRPILKDRLAGKKILVLSGGKDRLVPYAQGEPFLTWLKKAINEDGGWASDLGIDVEDILDEDAKHEFSAKMRVEAERWLCDLLNGHTGSRQGGGSKL